MNRKPIGGSALLVMWFNTASHSVRLTRDGTACGDSSSKMAAEESPPSHLAATLPVVLSSITTVTSAVCSRRAATTAAVSRSSGEQQRNNSTTVSHAKPHSRLRETECRVTPNFVPHPVQHLPCRPVPPSRPDACMGAETSPERERGDSIAFFRFAKRQDRPLQFRPTVYTLTPQSGAMLWRSHSSLDFS